MMHNYQKLPTNTNAGREMFDLDEKGRIVEKKGLFQIIEYKYINLSFINVSFANAQCHPSRKDWA